jgi:phosphoenolpyruvate carboxykinase (GTP)
LVRAMAAMRFLGKKCFALRIASTMGREQGWLAEHMLILGSKLTRRKKIPCGGSLPVGVRKDKFFDDDPPQGFRGLEGNHGG